MIRKTLTVVLFLIIAVNAFAQLTLRGVLDTTFVPFQLIERDVEGESKTVAAMGMGRLNNNDQNIQLQMLMEGKYQELIGFRAEFQIVGVRYTDAQITYNSTTQELRETRVGLGQHAGIWYRPFPFLRLDVGKFVANDLRGRVGDTWTRKFTVGCYDQDEIFSQFRAWGYAANFGTQRSDFGFLSSAKFDNFSAFLLLPGLFPTDMRMGQWFRPNGRYPEPGYPENNVMEVLGPAGQGELLRTLERTQFALGYAIPNIGFVRAQWIGSNITGGQPGHLGPGNMIWYESGNFNIPRIEAAFQLTAVDKLVLDLGVKYHLPWNANEVTTWDDKKLEWSNWQTKNDKGQLQKPYQVALGAVYSMTPIVFTGRFDGKFGGTYDFQDGNPIVNLPMHLNFHLWPTYAAGFATIGLDFGLEYWSDKTQGDVVNIEGGLRVGGGVWIEKRWGGCIAKAGLLYRAPDDFGGVREDGVLSVPVYFECRF